ncbi:hypothetical protein D3C85_1741990 [compost metagenome]
MSLKFFVCPVCRFKTRADIIGTYVSDNTKAPRIAKETVCAIGPNIFPSIPTKARIGKYTIRMIISPNAALLLILEEAL